MRQNIHTANPPCHWRRRILLGIGGFPLIHPLVQAQSGPTSLKLVVPYAAGGSSDYAARLTAQHLAGPLGYPVVVDNKPGANSILATQFVSQAPADGSIALVAGTAATTANPFLYRKLPFDSEKAFSPIGMISRMPFVVVVNAKSEANNIADFIRIANSRRVPMNYGSAGNGNPTHLAGALFAQATGIRVQQIPHQGSAPSMASLLAGETDASFEVLQTVLPMIKAGRLKALAVMAAERHPKLLDVPTLTELGFGGLDVSTSFAILVPAKTPSSVQNRLHEALMTAISNPSFIRALEEQALQSYPVMTQAQTADIFATERVRWKAVIERNAITH